MGSWRKSVIIYHQIYWELFTSLYLSHISDMAVKSGDSAVTIMKIILQAYNAKQFELSTSKTNTHLWSHFSKEQTSWH